MPVSGLFSAEQLGAKSGNARARYFGEPSVICIGDHFEQCLDTAAPDRRHDPELGKIGAD